MKIGIIGLTTTATPGVTNPKYVAPFDFIEYRQALEEYVPKIRDAGADIVILTSHVCTDELTRLAWQVKSLDIAVMGGGHCHELYSSQVGDTVIIEGGSYLASYAYVQLTLDPATKEITNKEFGTRMNSGGKADEEIAQIVQSWQKRTDAELNVTIGYLEKEIPSRSRKMEDLITKSWLNGYPAADIAITNRGGIRDNLPAGDITLASIISVMPFDNTLIALSLTGKQVIQVVERGKSPAVGGIHKSGDQWIIDKTGEPLGEDKTYVVLVNDFMYAGGDNYDMLAQFDPDAYDTSIGWRDPVIDWIREQGSTPEKPLDLVIEGLSG
jgi:5'-nucleotidase/UDP-sugar diphosphatase